MKKLLSTPNAMERRFTFAATTVSKSFSPHQRVLNQMASLRAVVVNIGKNNENIINQGEKMKTLLSLLLIVLMIGTVIGCQKSVNDHGMTPEQHKNM